MISLPVSLVAGPPQSKADLEAAVNSGLLSYLMTEPEEVIALFGPPAKTEELKEGGGLIQLFHYQDTLIAGFDPPGLLRSGLDPGLGLRKLHRDGIDGRGVRIAVIDQPLLREHVEYRDAVTVYEPIAVDGAPHQMHGSGVACIAVGKNRGVAPGARLAYFAVPMWKGDNQYYVTALKKVLELNRTGPESERIRAVSISDGMFRQHAGYEEWLRVLREVEESGVFVVTCEEASFAFGTLQRIQGGDADNPEAYRKGKYTAPNCVLLVPTGNMTRASQRGPEVYAFDRDGGRSWAAPYIAGLAALACQVRPEVTPTEIKAALLGTATAGAVGPVINPHGFVARIRDHRE